MTMTFTGRGGAVRRAGITLSILGFALVVVGVIAGCGEPAASQQRFNSTEVTSTEFGKDFHLTDQNGRLRQLSDFRGQVVAVFFGYTHCPDACPTALGELATIAKRLGENGRHLQVLFVTLDPQRDTPEVLRSYVPAFNPNFLGLYADADMTKQLIRDFKVFYEEIPGKTPTSYTIDHSVYTYAFDSRGRLRLLMAPTEPLEQKLEDLRALVAGA
jgi:protein SCO1/2